MANSKPLGHIEHVVVVMFENRSFDNILGDLYPHGPDFNGVPPGFSNPDGGGNNIAAYSAATGTAAQILPFPDPNEDYTDMAEQINGGKMDGFVMNYKTAIAKRGVGSYPAQPGDIMQYYSVDSGNIPITLSLAASYAVSDCYYGSGPVQTWPNRLFAHCGTPGFYSKAGSNYAYLNNTDYPNYNDTDPFRGQLDFKTVFELLDNANPSTDQLAWKVYYDDEVPISAFLKYVHDRWNTFEGGNVYGYEYFAKDVANDSLPAYSFIEPRYQKYSFKGSIPPNSNHPGGSTTDEGLPPISIANGEILLQQIFTALQSNKSVFDKTLLIVTYDEHGGLFDHQPPPQQVDSPFGSTSITNFDYTSLGPRVPAIFINPYVNQKVLRPAVGNYFDHTSIIATLREQFGLGECLTPRDTAAQVFSNLIDSSLQPNYGPKLPEIEGGAMGYDDSITEPAEYDPPKQAGTVADAVYRSYLANKGKRRYGK